MTSSALAFFSDILVAKLIQVGLIVLFALVSLRIVGGIAGALKRHIVERAEAEPPRQARLRTLLGAGINGVRLLILSVAFLMLLSAAGVNLMPVLASVGVLALAISLGAQTLIRDFIGGLLILIEDQFRVGDAVQIGESSGVVEQITLRATRVRDLSGRLVIVPNGDIRVVANANKAWARAVVDLNLAFDADMEKVARALDAAMIRAQADIEITACLLEPPQVLPWNSFNDWAIQVRLMAKTTAGTQWQVGRALRRHALAALEEADMRMAMPPQDIRSSDKTGAR